MLDRIPGTDTDTTPGGRVERLERRRECLDMCDELSVRKWIARPGDRDRLRSTRGSTVQMLDWSQGLLRLALVG